MKQFAQGDVWFLKVDSIPEGMKESQRVRGS